MVPVNYYPHHIGDYLRDTVHLNLTEHGAYRRMLDLYYASEKPLPLDTQWVCRLICATTTTEKDAVDFILCQYFEKTASGWINRRADAEIRSARKRTNAAKENGKKGGRPRTQRVSTGLAKSVAAETQAKAPNNQEPVTNNQEPKKKNEARKRATPLPEGFQVSERVKEWAVQRGFNGLDRYLEFFIGRMKANGKTYIDWDEAFMNCIREDWPDFRKSTTPDYSHLAKEPS